MPFKRGDFVTKTSYKFFFSGWVLGSFETINGTSMTVVENSNSMIYLGETSSFVEYVSEQKKVVNIDVTPEHRGTDP